MPKLNNHKNSAPVRSGMNIVLVAEIMRVISQAKVLLEITSNYIKDEDAEMLERTRKMIDDLLPKLTK